MGTWIDHEHHLRRRAERVLRLFDAMWGDEAPPPSRNPRLAMLVDAFAGDDEHGRVDEVVVHGDGLMYRQLVTAITATTETASGWGHLPADLLARLEEAGTFARPDVSPGMAALPDERAGVWELDSATRVLTFDAVTARLIGLGHTGGSCELSVGVDQVHLDDQPHVAAALEETLSTGRSYQVRFRVVLADGSLAWRASRARVLAGVRGEDLRLVGFVAADQ